MYSYFTHVYVSSTLENIILFHRGKRQPCEFNLKKFIIKSNIPEASYLFYYTLFLINRFSFSFHTNRIEPIQIIQNSRTIDTILKSINVFARFIEAFYYLYALISLHCACYLCRTVKILGWQLSNCDFF